MGRFKTAKAVSLCVESNFLTNYQAIAKKLRRPEIKLSGRRDVDF